MSTFVTVNCGRPRAGRDREPRGLSSEWDLCKASPGRRHLRQDLELAQRRTSQAGGAAWGGGDSSSGRQPARLGAVGEVGPPSHLVETARCPNLVASCRSSQQESDTDLGILESFFFPGCCLDNGSEGSQNMNGGAGQEAVTVAWRKCSSWDQGASRGGSEK